MRMQSAFVPVMMVTSFSDIALLLSASAELNKRICIAGLPHADDAGMGQPLRATLALLDDLRWNRKILVAVQHDLRGIAFQALQIDSFLDAIQRVIAPHAAARCDALVERVMWIV